MEKAEACSADFGAHFTLQEVCSLMFKSLTLTPNLPTSMQPGNFSHPMES